MINARRLSYASMLIAIACMAAGYIIGGYGGVGTVIILLGCLWLALRFFREVSLTSYALLAMTGLAGFGLFINLLPVLMVIALVSALAAWDLEYFLGRVGIAGEESVARALERQHLLRLAIVCGSGLAITGVAFLIQARYSVGLAILAGLIVIVGLGQVIGFFARESD